MEKFIIAISREYGSGGTHVARKLAAELGIPCALHPCPEKRHRLHLDKEGRLTPRYYEIRDAMAAFFAETMEIRA